MSVWRIAKWSDTFETSDSRNFRSLPWVSVPTNLASEGYQSLVDQFNGEAPAIYGAWLALVMVASKAPVRGTLANSKGEPYSLTRIIKLAYMHHDCLPLFEKLVEWASSKDIGWIEVTEQGVADATATPQQRHDEATTGPNRTDNQSIRSIDTGEIYRVKKCEAAEWAEASPRFEKVRLGIQPDKHRKIGPADQELVIAAVMVERRCNLPLIDQIIKSIREMKPPPTKPFAYFKKAFVNACQDAGFDGRRALLAIDIPQAEPPP